MGREDCKEGGRIKGGGGQEAAGKQHQVSHCLHSKLLLNL